MPAHTRIIASPLHEPRPHADAHPTATDVPGRQVCVEATRHPQSREGPEEGIDDVQGATIWLAPGASLVPASKGPLMTTVLW